MLPTEKLFSLCDSGGVSSTKTRAWQERAEGPEACMVTPLCCPPQWAGAGDGCQLRAQPPGLLPQPPSPRPQVPPEVGSGRAPDLQAQAPVCGCVCVIAGSVGGGLSAHWLIFRFPPKWLKLT